LNYIILGAIAVVVLIFAIRYSKAQNRKRMLYRIRTRFGTVPDREFVREDVGHLIDSERKELDIDEITWNDLDMDKVYSRINNCNSFIGEQVLYRRLHSIDHVGKECENREKMIQEFLADTKRREDVQVLLESIGRRKYSYYLPQFINDIDMFKITNIWFYRVMSFLLAGSLILGITLNQYFLYIFFMIALINLVLYTFGKQRFELQLGMLVSVVNVVVIANTLIQKYKLSDGELAKERIESAKGMSKAVNRIAIIQRKMETASSGDIGSLIFDYLIGSTLWDFHIFHRIVKRLTVNKDEFMKLYTYIGEIDATISIASFRESIPHYCQACFYEDNTINFIEMYHPLISNPVCNDVKMESNYIITG